MIHKKNAENLRFYRLLLSLLFSILVSGCGSAGAARQTEIDAQSTADSASRQMEQAALQAEEERQAVAQRLQTEREALEQRRRQDAEINARVAAARLAAEQLAAQQAQVEAEQQRQRLLAEQQREFQAQNERLAQLEREIEDSRTQTQTQTLANAKLAEAILAAEELLLMLNAEQAKYGDLDDQGVPRDPLQKQLINELEARKNSLVQEAGKLAQ